MTGKIVDSVGKSTYSSSRGSKQLYGDSQSYIASVPEDLVLCTHNALNTCRCTQTDIK